MVRHCRLDGQGRRLPNGTRRTHHGQSLPVGCHLDSPLPHLGRPTDALGGGIKVVEMCAQTVAQELHEIVSPARPDKVAGGQVNSLSCQRKCQVIAFKPWKTRAVTAP